MLKKVELNADFKEITLEAKSINQLINWKFSFLFISLGLILVSSAHNLCKQIGTKSGPTKHLQRLYL